MKVKNSIITAIIILFIGMVLFYENSIDKTYTSAYSYYNVYLKGNLIGMIADDTSLYSLINKEQEEIRTKYNVTNVYPPSDFDIIKTNTYHDKLSSVDDIYKKIEKEEDFTIKGYIVTIKDEEGNENIINVIDKRIFDEALKIFVSAFVDDSTYNKYINNEQEEIVNIGSKIEKMYFRESISIKEGFVSVNKKIFTDITDLSQYLLFGEDAKINEYEVKIGDTLATIAEDHKLNTQEILIANPSFRDENTILSIGEKLNVTYLNPKLNLVYDVLKVEDVENQFEKKTIYDDTKAYNYSEITQVGVSGLTRLTETYQVVNGEANSEAIILSSKVLTEMVAQITTKGRRYSGITGEYIDTGLNWGWPTNSPYLITSYFAWRWGKLHEGIDISGTGTGSPIYAAGDGIVIAAGSGGMMGSDAGYNVVVQHQNNYYTIYAHMVKGSIRVSVGQKVTKGQIIGGMGQSGFATGTHLHFGVSIGEPYKSGYKFINPLLLYR